VRSLTFEPMIAGEYEKVLRGTIQGATTRCIFGCDRHSRNAKSPSTDSPRQVRRAVNRLSWWPLCRGRALIHLLTSAGMSFTSSAPGGTRTPGQLLRRQLLCPLSYRGYW
jgi:hypothetical protein